MSAPTLNNPHWRSILGSLKRDWDGYGALLIVYRSRHVEIEIGPDGMVQSCLMVVE